MTEAAGAEKQAPSKAAGYAAVGFLVVVLGLCVWLNVYTVLRWQTQAAIEAGERTTGTLVESRTHRDVRGWGSEFVAYTFEVPGHGTVEAFHRIDEGLFDLDPAPGDPVEVLYLADDPEVSNLAGNGAQMAGWIGATALVDLVLLWAIGMAVRGARSRDGAPA